MPKFRVIWKDGTSEVIEADSASEARAKARYSRHTFKRGPIESVEQGSVRTEQSVRGWHPGGK